MGGHGRDVGRSGPRDAVGIVRRRRETPTRRVVLGGGAVFALAATTSRRVCAATATQSRFAEAMARIEADVSGRLGVCLRDTGSRETYGWRAAERFPLCSTFKALAGAAVLARVDAGQDELGRRVVFAKTDLVPYSPVTETRTGGEGMTLAELCEAAITRSDNTAGNLLLSALGGPEGLTAFARSLGDPVTRLDRWETALNEAMPGDPRDTTTPEAIAGDLEKLVLGDGLSAPSRALLAAWLVANKTGDARLRAGFPRDWRVGDKTGSGERGTANDVAAVWPPDRAPLIVCVYLTETTSSMEVRNAAVAAVARAVTTIVP